MTIASLLLMTASLAFGCATVPFWQWDYQPHGIEAGYVILILAMMEILWFGVNVIGHQLIDNSIVGNRIAGKAVKTTFVLMIVVQFAFALQIMRKVGMAIAG